MLLLAILISAIIIAIGLGISNFVLKELILSATARNSFLGFYSADAGVECAHYWDDIFKQRGGSAFDPDPPERIFCDDKAIDPIEGFDFQKCRGLSQTDLTYFDFSLGTRPADQYTEVNVCKGESPSGIERTRVTGDGYNNERPSDPKRIQRSHQSEYDT